MSPDDPVLPNAARKHFSYPEEKTRSSNQKKSSGSEIERIADLLERTVEGEPYYGPSVLGALKDITADVAARQPRGTTHSIWRLVAHLTAELRYARAVLKGTAGPWIEGETTWPRLPKPSDGAWQRAVKELKQANRALVRTLEQLDDAALDQNPVWVRGPFYFVLHGTLQHNVYHAGQISLLTAQMTRRKSK